MKTELVRRVSRTIGRWRGWNLAVVTVLLTLCLVMPQTMESQILPSPCCAILSAGLSSVAGAITNVIGSGLNTISATMITDRALLAIIENNQQSDGSVVVPAALRHYVDGKERLTPPTRVSAPGG